MSSPSAIDQCRTTARAHAKPLYLAALFLPPEARDRAFATIAFDHELARIPHAVTEPLLGEMRLQWWRDALATETTPEHPVLQALEAVRADRSSLRDIVDARAADVYPEPCADLTALETYATATAGALLALWQPDDGGARAAARNLGTAWALLSVIRDVPEHAARGKAYIPEGVAPVQVLDRATQFMHRANQQATLLTAETRRGLRLSIVARREMVHLKRHLTEQPIPPRFDRLDALHLTLGR